VLRGGRGRAVAVEAFVRRVRSGWSNKGICLSIASFSFLKEMSLFTRRGRRGLAASLRQQRARDAAQERESRQLGLVDDLFDGVSVLDAEGEGACVDAVEASSDASVVPAVAVEAEETEEVARGGEAQDRGSAEARERGYFIHKVSSADTLGGLELRYGVSASSIRRLNGMTSDRLTAHLHLKIPFVPERTPTNFVPKEVIDEKTERMQVIRIFNVRFPGITEKEIDFYLKEANGSARDAVRAAQFDFEWERRHGILLKTRSFQGTVGKLGSRKEKSWSSWISRSKTKTTEDASSSRTLSEIRSNERNIEMKKSLQMVDLSSPAEDVLDPDQSAMSSLSVSLLEKEARETPQEMTGI